ncbi:MAG: acetyl-CoA carboxylase biotin carboxyl carrier protein [Gammaproteobacteria bacterium]|nr:acetyl-CoA carboxylase biotin carboxyl carrier protein [Gammaproteobacteria bacterium]
MSLSHKDVQDILRLLEETDYRELTLETEHFTLKLQQDEEGWTQQTNTGASDKSAVTSTVASIDGNATVESAATEEGLLDIRAPMVGTFYNAPKPGADPFVEIGSSVNEDSVIAIIEVMKLMNSIPAGLSGEIVEILIDDAQFVEKGQLLMRVRPS